MSDALKEHDGKVSTGGKNITNLQFADDTDALAEEKQETEALNESLDKNCTRYQMEIRAEKTKLMTNNANGIHREIKVKGRSWTLQQASITFEQLIQMMAPNQRLSQGLNKQL